MEFSNYYLWCLWNKTVGLCLLILAKVFIHKAKDPQYLHAIPVYVYLLSMYLCSSRNNLTTVNCNIFLMFHFV